jgi:hypothetical protein
MCRVLILTSFFGLLWQSSFGQSTYPAIPEADYVVYTAIANEFLELQRYSICLTVSGELLYSLNRLPTKESKYSFRFNFAEAQDQLYPF